MKQESEIEQLRRFVADLVTSSGCSCCRDDEGWEEAQDALGKKLDVARYYDDSGWDWYKYRTKGDINES
jgi:hypothetical protein